MHITSNGTISTMIVAESQFYNCSITSTGEKTGAKVISDDFNFFLRNNEGILTLIFSFSNNPSAAGSRSAG